MSTKPDQLHDKSLQTLYSRIPTRFTGSSSREELLRKHGYYDRKRQRRALYTSFSKSPDSLGFSLKVQRDRVLVMRDDEELFQYDAEVLEAALLSKHSETAYITVSTRRASGGREECRFGELTYCKWPSVLRFIRLIREGEVYLDLTLSRSGGRRGASKTTVLVEGIACVHPPVVPRSKGVRPIHVKLRNGASQDLA